jgi:hypothetical protein
MTVHLVELETFVSRERGIRALPVKLELDVGVLGVWGLDCTFLCMRRIGMRHGMILMEYLFSCVCLLHSYLDRITESESRI